MITGAVGNCAKRVSMPRDCLEDDTCRVTCIARVRRCLRVPRTPFQRASRCVAADGAALAGGPVPSSTAGAKKMRYDDPGTPRSKIPFKKRYQNLIAAKWQEPTKGQYFENVSPVKGKPFCAVPRSDAEDIE